MAATPPSERKAAAGAAKTWTLRQGLLASLLLHALLAVPVLAARHLVPEPPPRDKLVVELFGMVTDRQTEESHAGQPAEQVPAATPPAQAPPPAPKKRAPVRQTAAESPVKVADRKDTPSPLPETPLPATEQDTERTDQAPPPEPAQAAPAPAGTGPAEQVRQTIQNDFQAQRRYMMALTKAIRARLTYPPGAGGATGMTVVAFRLHDDGSIEPGSLLVRTSSGNAVLDEQALYAVRAATPFEPPPKSMAVVLDIPFTDDRR